MLQRSIQINLTVRTIIELRFCLKRWGRRKTCQPQRGVALWASDKK